MPCPRYPLLTTVVVPSRLSCLSCPVLAVIFWPFCLCFLSWLHYPVGLSDFPVPAILSWLSCPRCPIPAVLPSCPVPAILSQLSYSGCPVPAVLSLLPCPCCSVLPVLF
jgi:hypothetical protein